MSEPVHVDPVARPSMAALDTEGSRHLVGQRLALFGQVAGLLSFGFFVMSAVLHVLDGGEWTHAWTFGANKLHVIASALLGALWATCRHVQAGQRTLLALDAFVLVATCTCWAAMALYTPQPVGVFPALLATTNTLLARAVIVPSSSTRTAVVSMAACVPVMAVGISDFRGLSGLPMEGAFAVLWCIVASAIATVGSRVIYGLRAEVREARRMGQYTLEKKLGEGGMGEVYLARHALLRRPTAIKLIRPSVAGPGEIERFQREVHGTSRLTHPNTIAIYDYGRTDAGVFYYAMEYLEGPTLQELARAEGPQPPGRVIHFLRQACGSLAEAHDMGLVHRDVKPANLIACVRGGAHDVIKVLDFGLVKNVSELRDFDASGAGLTATNTIAGTPLHLSPEAISTPDLVGPPSDLYALGTVGWYLLAGRHVFEGKNLVEVCGMHLHVQPERPSVATGRAVPSDLEDVILRCLAKRPGDRPADARALDAMLAACADAGRWTEDDAARWWRERWHDVRAARHRRPDPDPIAGEAPTIVVERRRAVVGE